MKCFSLLFGKELRLAPGGKKIIDAKEFSTLLSAQELIQQLSWDTVRYKEDVAKECALLKDRAELVGYEEGLKKWSEQLAICEQHLQKVKEEIEKMIAPIALQAAKKIVGREIELSPQTMIDIVKQSLKAVANHRRFTIFVNKQDLATFESSRPDLKKMLENAESLNLMVRDDIKQGDAVIETEGGIMNVQMEQLWLSLEQALHALMKT